MHLPLQADSKACKHGRKCTKGHSIAVALLSVSNVPAQ